MNRPSASGIHLLRRWSRMAPSTLLRAPGRSRATFRAIFRLGCTIKKATAEKTISSAHWGSSRVQNTEAIFSDSYQ